MQRPGGVQAVGRLPLVVVVGDSIRLGWEPVVRRHLRGVARVWGPGENGRDTAFTLERLGAWLRGRSEAKVVAFNSGLHDVGRSIERVPAQVPLETYASNLERIVERIAATGATPVWVSLTPVREEGALPDGRWAWATDDMRRYDARATEIMLSRSVPVARVPREDLLANGDACFQPDNVHLTERGLEMCAAVIVAAVGALLR